MPEALPILTIGHSTRSIADFVDLLRHGGGSMVVDVRTVPKSRHNPQYNEEVLGAELARYQIGYVRVRQALVVFAAAHPTSRPS